MQRRKVWVSVGAAVFVTSQVAAPSKSLAGGLVPGRPLVLAAQGGEGGEGGEAGAAYDAKLPRTLRFFRNMQLIRGHLLVGNELVAQGRWAEALPHFLHPSEEIYPKIRDDLKTYSVVPFAAALKALAQTVKAKRTRAPIGPRWPALRSALHRPTRACGRRNRIGRRLWLRPYWRSWAARRANTRKPSRTGASPCRSSTRTRAASSGRQISFWGASARTSRRRTRMPSRPRRPPLRI